MSGNQTQTLGLTCPEGGDFYICPGKATEFIGCCTSDPCTDSADGHCPTRDLRPASFDPDRYANIPAQSCDDARSHRVWWTCRDDDPTFLGCCATNPCGGGCPRDHLIQAVLSEDEDNRLAFVPGEATTSPTPTTSASPTASPSPSDEASGSSGSPGLPTGAIVGIAIGGALAVVILAILVWKFCWKARRRGKDSDQSLHTESGFSHVDSEDGQGRGGHGSHSALRNSDLSSTSATIPYSNRSTPTTVEFAKTYNGYHPIQPSSPPPAAHAHAHAHMPHSPGYTDSENGLLSGQPSPPFPGHMRTVSHNPAGLAHLGHGQIISEIDGVEKPRRNPGVPEIQIDDVECERPRAELSIAELPAEEVGPKRWC
ncbi:hypothetical protein ACRALDRAFT_2055351 [Sodiomyces alcalophilus JCM 7366]|uniref:uncharacterized protein n=1 Tax=Sodiomyces alcalophilus JCM 7366 TaxID=591952 RepID=UPI0039B3BDAF